MANVLEVLLDISVLGIGQYRPNSRTGVYRTVDCLLRHLLLSPSCRLSLTATESLAVLAMAQQYHTKNIQQHISPFVIPEAPIPKTLLRGLQALLANGTGLAIYGALFLNLAGRKLPFNLAAPSKHQIKAYDIVHATYFSLPHQWRGASPPCRFQTVYDLIPLLMPQLTTRTHRLITRRCIETIQPDEWVLAISQATKDDLCAYTGINPDRVFVTHLAASDLFYHCYDLSVIKEVKDRYSIPEGPYILSLCTLEPRKNIPHLIRCFADLIRQEHIPDLNLVLVGTTGWKYEEIFNQIGIQKDLQKRIIITGYLNDRDLAPLYSGASMFVYPSLYEGFGLPPLEAMQCGVPVITSNTSSLPEVVGKSGIMVAPSDTAGLSEAMLNLYRKPSLAAYYAEQSRARARLFSWERCADQTIRAYQHARACQV